MHSSARYNLPFQSTLSVRRATGQDRGQRRDDRISIHALRKESDCFRAHQRVFAGISIHALRKKSDLFRLKNKMLHNISIHALRKESDST